MARICQVTGKKALTGNNVSHSNRKTKRRFQPNLFKKSYFLVEENRWVDLIVSASGIRTINKKGLLKSLRDAKTKGLIEKF